MVSSEGELKERMRVFREEWAELRESTGMVKYSETRNRGARPAVRSQKSEEWEGAITGIRGH